MILQHFDDDQVVHECLHQRQLRDNQVEHLLRLRVALDAARELLNEEFYEKEDGGQRRSQLVAYRRRGVLDRLDLSALFMRLQLSNL